MDCDSTIRGPCGSTLLETLVALAILGITLGLGAVYLTPIEAPLESAASLVESICRQARLSAIATTSACRIRPGTAQLLVAEHATSCAETIWTEDDDIQTELPRGVTVESTAWSVCFSSRGASSDNQEIRLQHAEDGSIGVEVLLGGTTRVVQ